MGELRQRTHRDHQRENLENTGAGGERGKSPKGGSVAVSKFKKAGEGLIPVMERKWGDARGLRLGNGRKGFQANVPWGGGGGRARGEGEACKNGPKR